MTRIHEFFALKANEFDSVSCFIAGMECEIESVSSKNAFLGFEVTTDNSLRNEGVEFISVPLQTDELLSCFKNLHAHITYYDKAVAFSPRTSTHVHINCRTLSPAQARQLVLFYALFEEFFFAFVEPSRRSNIHCVPLTETFLPQIYKHPINAMVDHWHKYTALNILPLTKYGTIEFRHLQGTDDVVLVKQWLSCLEQLWSLAQKDTITAHALTDEVRLKQWWSYIFKDCPQILALEPSFYNVIRNNLMDVKLSLI
ncbi:Putative amidoligase enzyme [uncultured Caudovirales phage]|uniref:Amidoligase enzyme n=1 Tax=uncultured Caudovirales phage TaxID=2100421 RepID=A0A6J5LFB0_9CAUD|nr:Putative amidoligase enzyme [uncultured Caudovirales phage]